MVPFSLSNVTYVLHHCSFMLHRIIFERKMLFFHTALMLLSEYLCLSNLTSFPLFRDESAVP